MLSCITQLYQLFELLLSFSSDPAHSPQSSHLKQAFLSTHSCCSLGLCWLNRYLIKWPVRACARSGTLCFLLHYLFVSKRSACLRNINMTSQGGWISVLIEFRLTTPLLPVLLRWHTGNYSRAWLCTLVCADAFSYRRRVFYCNWFSRQMAYWLFSLALDAVNAN